MQLEIKLNGVNMSMGVPYYTMDEGQTTAKCAGVVPEAWSGAGYGRIPVTGGVIAWAGVPMSAFGYELARVYRINFYIAYDQGVNIGCSAYFDEIWVLNDGELPQNAAGADISVLAGGNRRCYAFH